MKTLVGVVTSTKMTKTIGVEVTRAWTHPIYKKTIKRTKKYLVHDEKEIAKFGDKVSFTESKPFSKRKRFLLDKVIDRQTVSEDLLADTAIEEAKA